MIKYLFVFLLLTQLIPTGWANTGAAESVYVNLGTHTEYFNKVQTDSSGDTRKFEIAPTVGAGIVINFPYDRFKFLPELNWVLPHDGLNNNVIKNLFMLRADIGYDPLDWLRFRLGSSIMHLNQHGRGGTTKINNGNGTSTFFNPDENRSSINTTFDLGAEILFEDWALRLQTYTYSLFAHDQRQLSYTIFISYYWDQ